MRAYIYIYIHIGWQSSYVEDTKHEQQKWEKCNTGYWDTNQIRGRGHKALECLD